MHTLKNWMLILVLLCESERQRWLRDASQYIKTRSEAQRFYVYHDASHLNRTKINIQNL